MLRKSSGKRVRVLISVITLVTVLTGLSFAASAAFPTARDALKWPFTANSPWNMPIGSGAVYQDAGIVHNSNAGYPTEFCQDQDVVVMKPTAPNVSVYYNGVGWDGGDRCAQQGGLLQTVPCPSNYTLPSSGENNSTAFLMADGHTVKQNQPFTRCSAGGNATTLVTFNDEDLLSGEGIRGAHGGSNLSALGGTIRLGEFTAGVIRHVMKVNLWAHEYYKCCSPIWPAGAVDGYANGTTYGGTKSYFAPGALLALPPTFNIDGLSTAGAKILAQAFIDYGAYVVDDTYWNAWAIITEQGPDGKVVDEFQTLYGYSMRPAQDHVFMTDIKTIFQSLKVVTNNSSSNRGGGGTPRQPLAPAFGSTGTINRSYTVPAEFNAFANGSSVRFTLPSNLKPGAVLKVHDIAGRTVWQKENLTPETSSVCINSKLNNGIYFASLSQGTEKEIRKVIFMR